MPVWPICFCSIWPMVWPTRLPYPSTPMSFIATPPSCRAPMAASAARSTASRLGCLPNFVMVMPRIQMSSVAIVVVLLAEGLEAEAKGLGARGVRADGEGGELELHARAHVVGVGLDVEHVAPDARAVAVDDPGHERDRDPRRRHRHDRERP